MVDTLAYPYASVSVVTDIIVKKFADALPLYLCAFLDHSEIAIATTKWKTPSAPLWSAGKTSCSATLRRETNATVFTLLETAKANGLNP